MDKPKAIFKIPSDSLLDPAKLRMEAVAKEHKDRFERIVQRLLDVVIEEKVRVVELPVIVSMMTGRINYEWDEALVEKVLKMNKKDDKTQN